jgi:hypothetical protein
VSQSIQNSKSCPFISQNSLSYTPLPPPTPSQLGWFKLDRAFVLVRLLPGAPDNRDEQPGTGTHGVGVTLNPGSQVCQPLPYRRVTIGVYQLAGIHQAQAVRLRPGVNVVGEFLSQGIRQRLG